MWRGVPLRVRAATAPVVTAERPASTCTARKARKTGAVEPTSVPRIRTAPVTISLPIGSIATYRGYARQCREGSVRGSVATYAGRGAEGAPGRAAAGQLGGRPTAWVCGDRGAARGHRRATGSADRDDLSGAAPARGSRIGAGPLVGGGRTATAILRAHSKGTPRAEH